MGLESTQSHMSSLGRGELLQGEVLDEDAIIAAYDAVTRADVQALAGELFRFETPPSPLWGGWERRRLPGAAALKSSSKRRTAFDMYPEFWTHKKLN